MQTKNDVNIVLIEPEIPQNTGNIARTAAAVGASLHLVGPMGFRIDDRKLKRAGLDYWDKLDVRYYASSEEFFRENATEATFFFTTKARKKYTDPVYPERVFLVFGKETAGISEKILVAHPNSCVRIPMRDTLRSLNLSNSVAIAVYEVFRQRGFSGLLEEGELREYSWEK